MSDFKAKMHRIRFLLGLHHRPHCRSPQLSPRPPAVFKGPTSKGREWGRGGGEEDAGEGEGRGKKGEGTGGESAGNPVG